MERSLTVLLPVHNAQTSLTQTVHEVLEVVSDLTQRFELVIVDDGSADATAEVGDELTRQYPQVRFVRHQQRLGREAAIQTGLKQSTGEVVLLRDEVSGLALNGIGRVWHATSEHGVLGGDRRRRGEARKNSLSFAAISRRRQPGYQIVDRQMLEKLHAPSRPTRPNYLTRVKNFALGE